VVLGCKEPPQLGRSNVIGARQMLADLDATCCCCKAAAVQVANGYGIVRRA